LNVYIWHNLERVTDNYHRGGGVVVIAASLDDARAAFLAHYQRCYETDEGSDIETSKPDAVYPCESDETKVFVFPDAGCC
jgi:hypothetical protein